MSTTTKTRPCVHQSYRPGGGPTTYCDEPGTFLTRALDGSETHGCNTHAAMAIEAGARLVDPPMLGRVWTLTLMTYTGTVPGAQHTYAALRAPSTGHPHAEGPVAVYGQGYRVERVLSEADVVKMTADDARFGRPAFYEAGESSERFDSEETARAAGTAAFRLVAPADHVLIEGSSAMAGPGTPLAGPPEIVEVLAPINALDESGSDTVWDDAREEALEQWLAAFARFGLDNTRKGYRFVTGYGYPRVDAIAVECTLAEDGTWAAEVEARR